MGMSVIAAQFGAQAGAKFCPACYALALAEARRRLLRVAEDPILCLYDWSLPSWPGKFRAAS